MASEEINRFMDVNKHVEVCTRSWFFPTGQRKLRTENMMRMIRF